MVPTWYYGLRHKKEAVTVLTTPRLTTPERKVPVQDELYQGREGAVEQTGKDRYRVPSLTVKDKFYEVNLKDLSCECPAYHYGHRPCRHIVLADAIAAIPSGPGASVATERITDLCREIFSRHNDPVRSYRCVTDVLLYGRSTEAMKRAAVLRHGKRVA